MTLQISYSQYKKIRDPNPFPDNPNKVNALFGIIVGQVFQQFYERELWKEPVEMTLDRVPSVLGKFLKRKPFLDWDDPKANYSSLEEVLSDINFAVRQSYKTIHRHGLYGDGALAEVILDAPYRGVEITGRADFIIPTQTHGLVILDGKGSKYRDKYLDDDQLYWYAKQYQIRTGALPDRVGFLHWRFSEPSWRDLAAMPAFESRLNEVVDRITSEHER